MKLRFKFREGSSTTHRDRLLAVLERDADTVEQLFPDEDDERLASLWSARIGDDQQFAKALKRLKRSRVVEFAEPEPRRHIYLPEELEERSAPTRG